MPSLFSRPRSADMPRELVVVKIGGSLLDLPDLGPRLKKWLEQSAATVLVVPGGGAAADAVRRLDQLHRLGESRAHWLALRAVQLNASLLGDLLGAPLTDLSS